MILIITFILLLIVCPLVCAGFYAATGFEGDAQFDKEEPEIQKIWPKPKPEDKMILWFVRYYTAPVLGKFWSKPVYKCLSCMASLHTIIPVTVFVLFNNLDLLWITAIWPGVALITSGTNLLIEIWWGK